MRRLVWGLVLWGVALAGSLEAGGYLAPGGGTPTLALEERLGEVHLSLLAQWPWLGVGLEGGLALGPLGYVGYGGQLEGGLGLGGLLHAEGGAGPVALSLRLGYRPLAHPPLFPEEGVFGRAAFRYREGPGVYSALLEKGEVSRLEGSYALCREATYTLGAGLSTTGPYLLLGWKGEVGEGLDVLDLAFRLGGVNQVEARLFLTDLSLALTLAYPWRGSLSAWVGDLGVEAGYKGAPYLWVRYVWRWTE